MSSDYIDAPIERIIAASKSDATNEDQWKDHYPRGIHLDADGTVKITTIAGNDVSLKLAGLVWHPIRLKRVWSTGTDAALTISLGW